MKILDLYVLKAFLKNYLLSFAVLVGLYVVLDMLFNFDELVAIQSKEGLVGMQSIWGLLQTIGDYYFYQMFVFFVQLSGIIPVVAAAFTLMRMSRSNELSAILSAGVPLLRVAVPIVLASVVFNGLLLVDQEMIIPQIIPKLMRSHTEARQEAGRNVFAIGSMQGDNNALLTAGLCKLQGNNSANLEKVDVIERDADYRPVSHLRAESADWDAGARGWRLSGATIDKNLDQPGKAVTQAFTGLLQNSAFTPEEISLYHTSSAVNLLSTERINQLLERPRAYGVQDLLRVKHTRFAQPLINIILILLAIPCVLTRQPGQLKSSVMRCLVYMGVCCGTVFLTQLLADHPPQPQWTESWAAVMAWVPIFIFGPLSVWLLDRIES